MSPHDLDDIKYEDAITMWKLYQTGMVGNSAQYITQYNTYAMLNQIAHILVKANGGKQKMKPEKFETLFKAQHNILRLKEPDYEKKLSLAASAAAALGGNMPTHIAEMLQQELDDG